MRMLNTIQESGLLVGQPFASPYLHSRKQAEGPSGTVGGGGSREHGGPASRATARPHFHLRRRDTQVDLEDRAVPETGIPQLGHFS